jgi:hypothetical protein
MHLLNLRHRDTLFKGHGQHSLFCQISVNLGYIDALVLLKENLATPISIIGLYDEVQLLGQPRLELMGQPTVLEVWENQSSDVSCELD